MRWNHDDRRLRNQARELRDAIGDRLQPHPGSNGHRTAIALQEYRRRRRRRRLRAAVIALLAIALLGLVHRSCVVYLTTQRRITAAERIILDEHARRLASGDYGEQELETWLQIRLDSLHRRYRAEEAER